MDITRACEGGRQLLAARFVTAIKSAGSYAASDEKLTAAIREVEAVVETMCAQGKQ